MNDQIIKCLDRTFKKLDEFCQIHDLGQQIEFMKTYNHAENKSLLLFDVLSMINSQKKLTDLEHYKELEVGEFRTSDGLSYIVFANYQHERDANDMLSFLDYAKDYKIVYPSRYVFKRLVKNIKLRIRFFYVHETNLSIVSGDEYQITFDDLADLISADSDCDRNGICWIQPERVAD